jgi:hypothetical protein
MLGCALLRDVHERLHRRDLQLGVVVAPQELDQSRDNPTVNDAFHGRVVVAQDPIEPYGGHDLGVRIVPQDAPDQGFQNRISESFARAVDNLPEDGASFLPSGGVWRAANIDERPEIESIPLLRSEPGVERINKGPGGCSSGLSLIVTHSESTSNIRPSIINGGLLLLPPRPSPVSSSMLEE